MFSLLLIDDQTVLVCETALVRISMSVHIDAKYFKELSRFIERITIRCFKIMVGNDARNKHILDRTFICSVCSFILHDRLQLTECGHRLCQSCFNVEQETTIKCRQCQLETLRINVRPDRGFKNDMQSLPIDCSFCQWTGVLNNYQKHFDQFHSNLKCKYCNEQFNSVIKVYEHKIYKCQKLIAEGVDKLSIEESNGFLDIVNHKENTLNQDLSSLQEKINDLQYISYDGILVWKITNFQEKMLDAQSKRQISIDSPLFYSSPTGYKMRARLYLNGYGNAHCTHMSAFFVLMRGLNDPILKFPFTYKVVFCLYDQSFAKQHIIDSFRPDIGVSGFQRPRLDMNIVSGISKFVPLTKIQQENSPYIRDDTMFIKIMLDFNDIPNISLPIAMSLNPGLPIHVQHMMIEQEMKQRSEQQSQYSNETKEIKLSCEETAQ
ncbi:unnamed protein product [Rotaria sp. Silwood1]|nr:unnamed protein product [Rotaria sp. Silwood1]